VADKASAENVTPSQLKNIWSKISNDDWFQLLNEFKPDSRWTKRGKMIVGKCIYHDDSTPSFHVDTERGFAHCFGSSCPKKHVWNPVSFAADIMSLGYGQALRQLKSRFGVTLPKAYSNNVEKVAENDVLKRTLSTVMNRELCDALVRPDAPEYTYIVESGLLPWLAARKLPTDVIHQLPIGVVPTQQRLYVRLEELPHGKDMREAAYSYLRDCFATPGNPPKAEGHFVFINYRSPTEIGRFRVRRPNGKKAFYAITDPYENDVGFFGLNMYPELLGNLSDHPLHAMEGEFDALSVIAHQLATGQSDICVVSTGGSMDNHLDQLSDFGFTDARLIPDNDAPGIGWTKNILANNVNVSRVFKWEDEDSQIKDVDQAIRAFGFETVYQRLNEDKNYQYNHEWAVEQAAKNLGEVDPGDVDARYKVAIEYGKTLSKESEREAYLDLICQDHGLTRGTIVQDLVSDDTPAGFRRRIAQKLKEEYHFLTEQAEKNTPSVKAWSIRKRVERTFVMDSEKKIRATLERDLRNLDDYISANIGVPDFIRYRPGPRGSMVERTDIDISRTLTYYASQAVSQAADETIPRSQLIPLGQGVHYEENADTGEKSVFVVNGTRFFHGKIVDDKITYEEVDSPLYGEHIFDLSSREWSRYIKTVADVQTGGEKCDPRTLFLSIKRMLDVGWKFYHHELESTFLAADILYTTIADVFQTVTLTDVMGATQSGKTTLLQLYGGNRYPGYRLCEAVRTLSDYSAAGVRNLLTGYKLRLILDEFEDNDAGGGRISRKALAVREILDLVRNMASGGASIIRAGDTQGTCAEYSLKFPLTVSGIFPMQEPQDLNRFVHIKTQHVDGFGSPLAAIQRKFSLEDVRTIRKGVTLCWLPRIPAIQKVFKEIQQEFTDGANLPAGMFTRMLDNFLPAAAILKYIGEDYVSFVRQFSELKMTELTEQGGATKESAAIWSDILHTPIALYRYLRDEEESITGISNLLADPHKHYLLDKIDLGVYYMPEKNWLIVFWQRALKGVLTRSARFGNAKHHGHLKSVADMDVHVIPREALMRTNFLQEEVWPRVNIQVGYAEISVYNLEGVLVKKEDSDPSVKDKNKKNRMMNDIARPKNTKTNQGDFDV